MARSSYIYIVFDASHRIIGTFTVKHEMETFVSNTRQASYARRFRDGQLDYGAAQPLK